MPPNPEPDGRVVVISHRADAQFGVTVLPTPACGHVFRTFFSKVDAFDFAKEMWIKHRPCGLVDQTEWRGPVVNKSHHD